MDARYSAYLLSDAWQQRRVGCFLRAGNRCEACGEGSRLQCHHLTYARIFDEPLEDLMALCDPHHDAIESMYRDGLITKTGDSLELRKKTLQLLCATIKREGAVYRFVTEDSSPKAIQEGLMKNGPFVALLGKPQKKFKKLVREMFKTHPLRNKILANAHVIYQKPGTTAPPPVQQQPSTPAPKQSSPQEQAACFAKDLDQLVQKYRKMKRRAIAQEMMRKIETFIQD